MRVTGNVKYIPAGTTQYLVDGSDGEINVDTSLSAITIVLPNIINSGYTNSDKGFIINDVSGNAGTNNITITATNNTVNSQASILIASNGGTAKCSIASMNEWFAVTEPSTSGMSGTLTPNYIPKAVTSSTLNDSVIYQNGTRIGVGTINPSTNFHVNGTNELAIITSSRYSSDIKAGGFAGEKARGTEASPSGVLFRDSLMTISAFGYTSGGAFSDGVGKMVFYTAEDFTASANGTAFKLSTTPIGTTVDVFNFGISENGDVSIGDINLSPSARLHVTGKSATSSNYALKVDNSVGSPLLYVRNDAKVSIGKVATLTTLDILGDTTNTLFKLNNANFAFADKLRIDNNGSFYSGSINAFGGFGTGTYTIDHLNYTFNTSFSTYLAFTNAGGAGNKTSYGIIGGVIGSADSDYRLVILNSDTSTISSSGLKVLSTGGSVANDGFDYYNYGVNINSSGVFTNSGSGTSYKIGLNVNVSNGEVNYAALFNGGSVGIGTTTPATSALLDLTSTTGALLVPRMTTVQKNALTAINGMILYDTTLDKFQGYEAGAWVNLV